jgi:adenylate kinase
MFIYIGGIDAAGKTTLIAKTIGIARQQNIHLHDAGVNQILCNMAGVSSFREWRILPEKIKDSIRPKMEVAIRNIDADDPETIRLRDVHFIFSRNNGERGFRTVQSWDKERLSGIAVIIANPTEIIRRRLKDIALRPDRKCDIKCVAKEQSLELAIAKQQSIEIGVPIRVIKNESPNIDKVCKNLFRFCTRVAAPNR